MSKPHFSLPPLGDLVADNSEGTWVRAEGADYLPCPVYFRFAIDSDGGLVVTGLHIEAEGEVTARDLRFPLARLAGDFLADVSKPATAARLLGELIPGLEVKHGAGMPDELPNAWKGLLSVPAKRRRVERRARPGRAGLPDEHFREVAAAYRRAKRKQPRAPIRAVMAQLHATEPTVHRWLRAARDKGFLDQRIKED